MKQHLRNKIAIAVLLSLSSFYIKDGIKAYAK